MNKAIKTQPIGLTGKTRNVAYFRLFRLEFNGDAYFTWWLLRKILLQMCDIKLVYLVPVAKVGKYLYNSFDLLQWNYIFSDNEIKHAN